MSYHTQQKRLYFRFKKWRASSITKKLLLYNIKDLHSKFMANFPEIQISLSYFGRLRPRECILAGQSGTNNVCVCKIHENLRLQFVAIKEELLRVGVSFNSKYQDLFKEMLCESPNIDCFFNNCQNCPGPKPILNRLQLVLEANEVSQINFRQWSKTDR